jgi:class 3 adenylate cyclase
MEQPELASFVPSLVARRLLERPDPPSTPEGERFDAAALFADISGFTALAERLARTGRAASRRSASYSTAASASWSSGTR